MKVTMLRDKLNTGIRYRLDDLTISDLVDISTFIENGLKKELDFVDEFSNDDDFERVFKSSTSRNIDNYKNMLGAIDCKKVIQLNCYNSDVEKVSFETIIKKYKKI